jgi:P-type conjugative transfer protein TrbJ
MSTLKIGRRAAAIAAIALLAMMQSPAPMQAGVLVGIATEWTQILNNIQLVNSYIAQAQQLAQQVAMYADMVRNSRRWLDRMFGPIEQDIRTLAGIVQTGRALAYSMGNLDGEFRARFRGYQYNAQTWFRDYRTWAETSLDSTLGTLRAAGLQGEQLLSEQAVLARLRQMATSADGRLLTLQVIGDIAEQQAQQMMKLRQLMLADLQSKQAFQAAQIQKDAATQAGIQQFFQYPGREVDGMTFQSGWK